MDIADELQEFGRIEEDYKFPYGLRYSPGIDFLAEQAHCYWLVLYVGKLQDDIIDIGNQRWTLDRHEEGGVMLRMWGKPYGPVLMRKHVPSHEIPIKHLDFYCVNGVVMLPSEYAATYHPKADAV